MIRALAAAALIAVAVPAAGDEQTEAARLYDEAVQRFEDGDLAGALDLFHRVYELAPNPLVLFNLAVTERKLSRLTEAVRTFKRYLASGAPEKRREVERALEEIERDDALIDVRAEGPPGATLLVDGRAEGVTPLDGPLWVAPGHHLVRLVRAGAPPLERPVEARAGAKMVVPFSDRALPALREETAPGELEVRTVPTGANVALDGTIVGRAPFRGELGAGPHQVVAELPGRLTAQAPVDILPGELKRILLRLPSDPGERPWYRRPGPWIGILIGALAIAGVVWLTVYAVDKTSTNGSNHYTYMY